MERVTSKTLDCFVEFVSLGEAVNAVNRFETNRSGGRGGRLGQRHVEVELSSQDALMKELFPKAKNVEWRSSKPVIVPRNPNDKYNSGFSGFISKEELVMLVKHVEAPQRVSTFFHHPSLSAIWASACIIKNSGKICLINANMLQSPFSKDCPQRPFECLISTLIKVSSRMPSISRYH